MQKTGHRITKHEMKEDSFVTFAFRAQEYVQTHQKSFVIGLGAIVVAVAGLWFFTSMSSRSETAAEQSLNDAFARVQQNDLDGATTAYHGVVAEYGGSRAAREALFYLANLHFVREQWQESINAFQQYADKYTEDHGRLASSYSAIGDSYQALKDYDKSLEYYDKALGIKEAEYLAPDIMLQGARSALMKGDKDRATSYAGRLFDLVGNSAHMSRMRELLALHGIAYTRGM